MQKYYTAKISQYTVLENNINTATLFPDNMKRLPSIQPLFITVDPERDTPQVLKTYLKGNKIIVPFDYYFISHRVSPKASRTYRN